MSSDQIGYHQQILARGKKEDHLYPSSSQRRDSMESDYIPHARTKTLNLIAIWMVAGTIQTWLIEYLEKKKYNIVLGEYALKV
ncbi:hypothetical protein PCANC_12206 [Puccinia coronata f. sp. avenae]|uniref:Uncharacterized protein n=1 Tax=Puccinia coronata f. sp. avenae TaxID=200324 RepID=A0A2N5VEY8_9BASI|nr:hypothetical protein PCANC_12206 [Puccinia coronata f. sp. avenae]